MENKIAEILVSSGYAENIFEYEGEVFPDIVHIKDKDWPSQNNTRSQKVEPFKDTLEGRRQADAIEDWLMLKEYLLYQNGYKEADFPSKKDGSYWHQFRLNRIKWCLEQLTEQQHGTE